MSDPTPGNTKAVASGLATAIMVVVAWAAKQFGQIDIPPEVAVAIAGIISTAAVYSAPHALGKTP